MSLSVASFHSPTYLGVPQIFYRQAFSSVEVQARQSRRVFERRASLVGIFRVSVVCLCLSPLPHVSMLCGCPVCPGSACACVFFVWGARVQIKLESDLAEHEILRQRLDRVSREKFLSTPSQALHRFLQTLRGDKASASSARGRGGGGEPSEEAWEREAGLYKPVPRFRLPPREERRREAQRLRVLRFAERRQLEDGEDSSPEKHVFEDATTRDGRRAMKRGGGGGGEGNDAEDGDSSSFFDSDYFPPTELISDVYYDEDDLERSGIQARYSSSLLLGQRVPETGEDEREKGGKKKTAKTAAAGGGAVAGEREGEGSLGATKRRTPGETAGVNLHALQERGGEGGGEGEKKTERERKAKRVEGMPLTCTFALSEEDTSGKGGGEEEEDPDDDVVSLAAVSNSNLGEEEF